MVHRGEIVEKKVRESGYSITRLADKMGKSRRHMYNIFENYKVDFETIRKIGLIINHDFSQEFKELLVGAEDSQAAYVSKLEALENQKELNDMTIKYVELLEKYNKLLSEKLAKEKRRR
jgi:predicted transcriptional regulator